MTYRPDRPATPHELSVNETMLALDHAERAAKCAAARIEDEALIAAGESVLSVMLKRIDKMVGKRD